MKIKFRIPPQNAIGHWFITSKLDGTPLDKYEDNPSDWPPWVHQLYSWINHYDPVEWKKRTLMPRPKLP